MCSSFIYSCFLANSTVFLHVNFHFVSFTAGAVRPFCRGINCSACPVGVFFCEEKDAKEFLGQDCSRLSAGWSLLQRKNLHAYPAGAYFCMRKSRQNALGAVPQDPLAAKLRLDTNDAKHRPYNAADTLSRCLRRIICGVTANRQQKATTEKHVRPCQTKVMNLKTFPTAVP